MWNEKFEPASVEQNDLWLCECGKEDCPECGTSWAQSPALRKKRIVNATKVPPRTNDDFIPF